MKLSNILKFSISQFFVVGIILFISCSNAVPVSDVEPSAVAPYEPPSTSGLSEVGETVGGYTDESLEVEVAGDAVSGHWGECTPGVVGPNWDDAITAARNLAKSNGRCTQKKRNACTELKRYKSTKLMICGFQDTWISCKAAANWVLGDLSMCVRNGEVRGFVRVRGTGDQDSVTVHVQKV